MIYGNHNKRIGDLVTVARWDDDLAVTLGKMFPRHKDVGSIIFMVRAKEYHSRLVFLRAEGGKDLVVRLDDTNLIRVGRITDK